MAVAMKEKTTVAVENLISEIKISLLLNLFSITHELRHEFSDPKFLAKMCNLKSIQKSMPKNLRQFTKVFSNYEFGSVPKHHTSNPKIIGSIKLSCTEGMEIKQLLVTTFRTYLKRGKNDKLKMFESLLIDTNHMDSIKDLLKDELFNDKIKRALK